MAHLTLTQQLKHQQRLGRRPSDLTANQLKADAIRAASWAERSGMVVSAIASAVRTRVLRLRCEDEVAAENERICRTCPSGVFHVSSDGHPYCDECGCSGKMLMSSKWMDPTMQCPRGHWDNTIRDTVEVTVNREELTHG